MSAQYVAISWNKQKRIYDLTILTIVLGYLLVFVALNLYLFPDITVETLFIRGTGTLAILLLHLVLMIGPCVRMYPVLLPLLYNRRHLGVTTFFVAAIHGVASIVQFHSLGNLNPILSLFISNTHYESLTKFPFQTLGFISLLILLLMVVTSHDFWLKNLGPWFWKMLHMLVYAAYFMVVLHVMLGAIQYETSPVLVSFIFIGMSVLILLHVLSSADALKKDLVLENQKGGFIKVCDINEIKDKRAKIARVGNEQIAIFRYDNKVSAISNVCKHQGGPLGEGKIIDGCITCPWHGYQYFPHNGSSPPPFKEKVFTYDVKIVDNQVWLDPRPYPEGTFRTPATFNLVMHENI